MTISIVAIKNFPIYFPYKKVSSICITDLQCLNTSMHAPKAQNICIKRTFPLQPTSTDVFQTTLVTGLVSLTIFIHLGKAW